MNNANDFRAPCPLGCMWNESGGENVPMDTALDDQLDVSDVVKHRGGELGKHLGGGGMALVVQLDLGEIVAFDFIDSIKGSSTTK